MNLKKNILISLLLAIGLVISEIVPPFLGGMRFDFLLSFMFICLVLVRDIKSTLLIGILGGLLSAFATTFPGGHIPNILEKIVVSLYIYGLLKVFKGKITNFKLLLLSLTGTFLSGFLFLTFAKILVGLPASLTSLLVAVVLPATVMNGLGTVLLYKLVEKSMKMSNFKLKDI